MAGTTIATTAKTLVGGVPMPSLLSMAMGALFKGVFKGVGRVANRLHAQVVVSRFMQEAAIHGDDAFQSAVRNDLMRIARTAEGRSILGRLTQAGETIEIHAPSSTAQTAADFTTYGDHCAPLSSGGHVKVTVDPNGPYVATMNDGSIQTVSITGNGSGAGSRVVYDPSSWPKSANPGSPSDVILAHELNHAANNADEAGMVALRDPDPNWNSAWTNHEEANTVGAENKYREQRGGVPLRPDYSVLP